MRGFTLVAAALALLSCAPIPPPSASARNEAAMTAWIAARQATFVKWQAGHPGWDGRIETSAAPLELWDCPECPKMVAIPAGRFTMGSPDTETDESPRGIVTIARPFALSRTHVTRGEFAMFLRETGYKAAGCPVWDDNKRGPALQGWTYPDFGRNDDYPAMCVSFDDAQAYVAWLNGKAGRPVYRLPSEAEWEYAARAGTTVALQCEYADPANDLSARPATPSTEHAGCRDVHVNASPVGSFRPNPFGLYDMLGNAWDWTGDCYRGDAHLNGTSGAPGDCKWRVRRGCVWSCDAGSMRSVYRGRDEPGIRFWNLGFRLARALP